MAISLKMRTRLRVFISITMFYSFLVISFSGVMLYISPKGRIANWVNWTQFGLTKEGWAAVHTVFVTAFLIAGLLHLFIFNWKAFASYITRKQQEFRYLRETVAATALFAVLLVGSIYEIQPVIAVYEIGEGIKESYDTDENEPPIPHAEELTVAEFAAQVMDSPTRRALGMLDAAGRSALDSTETIGDLAERYGVSPSEIYDVLQADGRNADAHGTGESVLRPGGGYGRMSFDAFVAEMGVPAESARERLAANGITDVAADETIKDLADRYDMNPLDVARIIVGEATSGD